MANEATSNGNTELSETAQRYDRLRKSIPFIRPPDTLIVTGGLAAAFPDDLPSDPHEGKGVQRVHRG